MTPGERLAAEALALAGVPWRHMGRTPEGLDCVGLVLLAARRAGLPEGFTAEPPPYSRHSAGPAFEAALSARCGGRRVARDALEPGDLLAFADGLYPCHVAVAAAAPGMVVHAFAPRRRVVVEPLAHGLLSGLRACFRPAPAPGAAAP